MVNSKLVASLIPNIINGAEDFSESTTPNKTTVDLYIYMIYNLVNSKLRSAGYKIPLLFSNDNYQEDYIDFVVILGVAKWITKNTYYPSGFSKGDKDATNIFESEFNKELKNIYDESTNKSTVRLDAEYIIGSPAHRSHEDFSDSIIIIPEKTDYYIYKLNEIYQCTM